MIEIKNLTKRYGQIRAVNDISFSVDKADVVGFLGPNGAGKTTTMNIITGFIPPTSGTVEVCGCNILEEPEEVKRRIGYLPELPPLYMDMTVYEYLVFCYNLKGLDKRHRTSRLMDVMEQVKITDVRSRLIKNLSKGYKQRVGFAQALAANPDVLILDEPTIGLDPKQIIEIRSLISSLGKEHTVILSSHILPEVSAVCNKVIIINKGEISAIDTPQNLSRGAKGVSKFLVRITGPKAKTLEVLRSLEGVVAIEENFSSEDETAFTIETAKDTDIRKALFFELAKHNLPIMELKSLTLSLEDVFLQLTTKETEVSE